MNKVKEKIKYVWKSIFDEMTVAEYISWWIVRVLMIYALFHHKEKMEIIMCFVNTLALFALPFLRFIAPRKSFIAYLPIRCQHIVNLFEFLGSFLGTYVNVYLLIWPKFDWFIHFISGPLTVMAGYYIYIAFLKKEEKEESLSPAVGTLFGAGFSAIIIVLWEIVEFFGDFFFGTANQGYAYIPRDDQLLFKLFGKGAIPDGLQYPLWDTMIDMLYASVTTIVFCIILYVFLKLRIKKKKKSALEVNFA